MPEEKIGQTTMQRHKNYPIYASAVHGPENRWYSQGIVFAPYKGGAITEIKRLEGPTDLTFATSEEAEQHRLQLCRAWIDEQITRSK